MLKIQSAFAFAFSLLQISVLHAQAPPGGGRAAAQLPEGAGRETTQKVCGSTCHGPTTIMGSGRSRDQWTAVVNSMVARGAKATEPELAQIIGYLTTSLGPNFKPPTVREAPAAAGARRGGPPQSGMGPGPLGSGAADSHVVDEAGAERGKTVFVAECASCHGMRARGGNEALPANQRGTDLIRSLLVLKDRYASELGPYLAKGHPMRSGRTSTALSKEQVADIAHFLHQRVYYTLRTGPELEIQNILTGNPKAGEAYFNGAGKCGTCHSVTGDLAHIGTRYDAPTIQMKFLFPRTVAFGRGAARPPVKQPVTVSVTLPSGETVQGVLDKIDDFNVSLRDSEGEYRAFKITPRTKVVEHDPAEAHVTMLDHYTDDDIHNVVAYLETLK